MSGVLVLGGGGMLGHKMLQTLRARFPDTVGTIRGTRDDAFHRQIALFQSGDLLEGVDALQLEALESLLATRRPGVVVNCVGVIKQRAEAKMAIPSIAINALLPHRLASLLARWGGRLIHFSTDCVFSGRRGRYTEEDSSDAEDLYGKTKFLGEVATENALTLRTSIIGRELAHFQSLLEWFLSQQGKTVRGFTRAYYSGVTTNYLSHVVADLIERHPRLSGLYQVVSPTISKHDLLHLLKEAYHLCVEILPDETYACDRSLLGDRFAAATGIVSPPWPELVAQLAADATPYGSWR